MKLINLFETVDRSKLLRDVAQELGLNSVISEATDPADVLAGIDLFKLHLDTDGSAGVRDRLTGVEQLAVDSRPITRGMEALEYLEGTTFEQLPHVHVFYEACKVIKATANKVRNSADVVYNIYFLLSAINLMASTSAQKQADDDLRYHSAIARACLKQLGITPKELE